MDDGSVLIINHGTAVPGEPPARPRQLPPPETEDWEGMPIAGYSPCEQLARHVCGMHDECATAEACNPARQLLAMEQQERKSSGQLFPHDLHEWPVPAGKKGCGVFLGMPGR